MKLIIKNGYAVAENLEDIRLYGNAHYDLLKSYENQPICKAITKGRINLIKKYCRNGDILDIGCGTGYFMKKFTEKTGRKAYGYDILPQTEEALFLENLYINPLDKKIPANIIKPIF